MSVEEMCVDNDTFELRGLFGQMTKLVEEMRDMRDVMSQANAKGYMDIVSDHATRVLMRIERLNALANSSKIILEQMGRYIKSV
jgi:hypothetical protein